MIARLITPPSADPVSLAETKTHLRVAHGEDDAYIGLLISAATQYLDGYDGILRRALVTQTWETDADRLPLAPVQSVTSGTLKSDALGFYVEGRDNDSAFQFTAGYGTPADVPAPLRAAILLHVAELYENRERAMVGVSYTPTGAYEALINPYRRWQK